MGLSESDRTRLVAFYDFGEVKRNLALPGERSGDTIASVGLGARVGYGKSLNMRLDVARIQKPTANREAGSVQVGAALIYIF